MKTAHGRRGASVTGIIATFEEAQHTMSIKCYTAVHLQARYCPIHYARCTLTQDRSECVPVSPLARHSFAHLALRSGGANSWPRPTPAVWNPSTGVKATPIGCLTKPTVVRPMKPVNKPAGPKTYLI